MLATLGAIHNLSFYQNNAIDDNRQTNASKEINHPDSMIKQMATISAALCAIYQWAPESVQSEIARVLGNLTRSLDARVAVHSAGGLQFLLRNLSSNDWDIVETSCGVLVNMLSDWERRAKFRELRGPYLLRDVLQRSAMKHDWLLALIACQVRFISFIKKNHNVFFFFGFHLFSFVRFVFNKFQSSSDCEFVFKQAMWNYIIDSGNVVGALGEDEADYISGDILEYLGINLHRNSFNKPKLQV